MKKIVFISLFSLFFISGCGLYGGGVIIEPSYSYGYNSPPAYAPAHRRRAHRYQYYPNAEFYFDLGTNMYYFRDTGAQWRHSVTLPRRLRGHLNNNYVEIEMDEARPYRQHKFYRNKYKKHETRYRRKHNNNRLNYDARQNRKHKYDSRSLDDGTRGHRQYKKKIKKHNKKYNRDDEEDGRHSKKKRNKHRLNE